MTQRKVARFQPSPFPQVFTPKEDKQWKISKKALPKRIRFLGASKNYPSSYPPSSLIMPEKFLSMVMKMSIDCDGCYRKIRRILLKFHELESHSIEKKEGRVSVCGEFVPQEIAVKLRKAANRRVEIVDVKEIEQCDGGGGGDVDGGGELRRRAAKKKKVRFAL